jgi:hypothetical protein
MSTRGSRADVGGRGAWSPEHERYSLAWRSYRLRLGYGWVANVAFVLVMLFFAIRLRLWLFFFFIPSPIRALFLRGFRCPRCRKPFSGGLWRLAPLGEHRCAACALPYGAMPGTTQSSRPRYDEAG